MVAITSYRSYSKYKEAEKELENLKEDYERLESELESKEDQVEELLRLLEELDKKE
ncbi:MAG: hypothetical protein U9O65_08545 [Thermotogota bacterium]|nr:hypothetical protein [Thermotogota bacterium]